MRSKPLANLSDEKKEKLLLLAKRFNLDMTDVVIKSGPNMGHWVKNTQGHWVVLKDKFGVLLWPNEQRQEPGNSSQAVTVSNKPKCAFSVDGYVCFINDPLRQRYQIKEIIEQDFGRTGYWCKLVDMYGSPAFRKSIESAELEPCHLTGEIYGNGQIKTISVY